MRIHNFLNPLSRVDFFESTNNLEPCGRANPDIFESADVAKSGLVLTRLLPHGKKNIQSKLCLCSNKSEAYTLMLNLRHFLSWHCLGVKDLEIYRKRLFEFGTLAWGQKGIILTYRSFLANFSFVNIILYLILDKVSLDGVLLLNYLAKFLFGLNYMARIRNFQWSTAHDISILPQLISMNIGVIRNCFIKDKTN